MAENSRIEWDPSPQPFSREIIGPSTNRRAITFFAPAVGRVTLSNDPVVADGSGFVLSPDQAPLTFYRDVHGSMVEQGWYALYSAGATAVGWSQVLG